MDKATGHKRTFNINHMIIEGKTIHLPHTGISLRSIIAFGVEHYSSGSRYYSVMHNGVHLVKVALPNGLLEQKLNEKAADAISGN